MLNSIFNSNPSTKMDIYFMHQSVDPCKIEKLRDFIVKSGSRLVDLDCKGLFEDTLFTNRYYSIEMYYRLLAPFILPESLDRILYLDPDIINLNSIQTFYEQDFEGNAFVATAHDYITKWVQPFNRIRLQTLKSIDYFNTGVLLMNLTAIREKQSEKALLEHIADSKRLILPDQDVFNQVYWDSILEDDWHFYNLDPRFYSILNTLNSDKYNQKWVEEEVVFIHYCGKHKPWIEKEDYRYELAEYYHMYSTEKEVEGTI